MAARRRLVLVATGLVAAVVAALDRSAGAATSCNFSPSPVLDNQ